MVLLLNQSDRETLVHPAGFRNSLSGRVARTKSLFGSGASGAFVTARKIPPD
jgi:hypothetical protein